MIIPPSDWYHGLGSAVGVRPREATVLCRIVLSASGSWRGWKGNGDLLGFAGKDNGALVSALLKRVLGAVMGVLRVIWMVM